MGVSSISSCSLKPPAPFKEAGSARPPQPTPATTTSAQWSAGGSSSLRRASVTAAAVCAVVGMGMADGGTALARDAAASSRAHGAGVEITVDARAGGPPRWSDRRQCPPWRANSLENVVPENLPHPSPQRRFNDVAAARTETDTEAPAPGPGPDAVAPFLARRSGSGMGCFSL